MNAPGGCMSVSTRALSAVSHDPHHWVFTAMLKMLSIVGYVGMLGGLLGLLPARAMFSNVPIVIALQVVALLLFAWARLTFGWRSYHVVANPTEGGLVTTGPYRYIRHPIYAAMCLFAWAGIAGHWSWGAFACGIVIVVSALMRILAEENMVTARYPEYAKYAANTRRLIPFVF